MKNEWLTIEEPISLKMRRCMICGSFWGVDQMNCTEHACTCPVCAKEAIRKATDRADAAERSARSLRGALKKAKRRTR